MRDGNTLWKKTTLVQVPVSAYNFFFLNMFCTHKHSIKLCCNTSIICFKTYLCSTGKVRNSSDAIFLLFFHNSFFFAYQHSDSEGSCLNETKTRHVNLAVACWP